MKLAPRFGQICIRKLPKLFNLIALVTSTSLFGMQKCFPYLVCERVSPDDKSNINKYSTFRFRAIFELPAKIRSQGVQIQYKLYYPTLLGEKQLVRIIEGSDNKRAKYNTFI